MILPCSLYGCEFLLHPSKSDIHYLKGLSDTLHVIYLVSIKEHRQLHLFPLESYIERHKLNVFGRLCNSNDTGILKCIFWHRLTLAIVDQRSNKTQSTPENVLEQG
jgi:hypothetical protein